LLAENAELRRQVAAGNERIARLETWPSWRYGWVRTRGTRRCRRLVIPSPNASARPASAFPNDVRAPISYGPRVKASVAYLLARQHLPGRRVAETLVDCFGLKISTGSIDAVYSEAARRLGGFIAALVALLKSLPVLHVDETSDRVGTAACWMHVVSTSSTPSSTPRSPEAETPSAPPESDRIPRCGRP